MKTISIDLTNALKKTADQLLELKQIDIDSLQRDDGVEFELSFNIPEYLAAILFGYLLELPEVQKRIFENGIKHIDRRQELVNNT